LTNDNYLYPKVSVIVPVYNGERTLDACLRSIANQEYKNYEIIVVNNNSTDNSGEIIKHFQNKNKIFKSVFEEIKSRGAARNRGIIHATGKIIVMTDCDCTVPKTWIKQLVKPIIFENEQITMGFEEDTIGNFWTRNIQKVEKDIINHHINGKYVSHFDSKNFAIRANLMRQLMFDGEYPIAEDFEFYLRLKKHAKIRFVAEVRVGHSHRNTLKEVILDYFEKAFWIEKAYSKNTATNKERYARKLRLIKRLCIFPFHSISNFMRHSSGEAFFLLVRESAWYMGIVISQVTTIASSIKTNLKGT